MFVRTQMANTVNRPLGEYLAAEADHRLLNNLQSVASLLSLQRQHCVSADAKSYIASVLQRVRSLERIHRTLHSLNATQEVKLKAFLQELSVAYSSAFTAEKGATFIVAVAGDELVRPTSQATALAIAVNELITNAIKYGTGSIGIMLKVIDHHCTVAVHNDGAPLRKDFTVDGSAGFGMRIVKAFVRQIRGEFEVERGNRSRGPTFQIVFPLARNPARNVQ